MSVNVDRVGSAIKVKVYPSLGAKQNPKSIILNSILKTSKCLPVGWYTR